MKMIEGDARRYAWCHGNALWLMGPPAAQWIEDMEGAAEAGQFGLVRHGARQVAEECAVMVVLTTVEERPLPATNMRAAWALERLGDHPAASECRALLDGVEGIETRDEAVAVVDRCRRLQRMVGEEVGEVPNPLTPEGYFPALGLARDWIQLLGLLDVEPFLPKEWTRRAHADA